jgi:hypothetical protein
MAFILSAHDATQTEHIVMQDFAELEIRLQRQYAEHYPVEVRFSQAGRDEEYEVSSEAEAPLQLDLGKLRELTGDSEDYGRGLSEMLFQGWVGRALTDARRSAQQDNAPLRVRLFISPTAWDLHNVRWETLRDPQTGEPLLTGARLWFSRFLSSDDWRRVQRRSRSDLRALLVIANPRGLDQYAPTGRPLAPISVADEVALARLSLGNLSPAILSSDAGEAAAASRRPTLNNLTDYLRDGYDILYLVCHGALRQGEPLLWLEDDQGEVSIVPGRQLVTRLREIVQVPRLVILASCQSAGTGQEQRADDDGALAALGPEVAKAGVPAVVAMQGNVTRETVKQFMPVFFRELQTDGQIDRAMAIARGDTRDRRDSWMPVLFSRLKSGQLWYAPGFTDEAQPFQRWRSIARSIRDGECTPILGPGLTEPLLGTRREIARRLARRSGAALVLHDRDDLPQVAQFIAVDQDAYFARTLLVDQLREEILERHHLDLTDCPPNASLNALMMARLRQLQQADRSEPHLALARMPFKIYVTTSPTDLLSATLRSIGKTPTVISSPWAPGEQDQALDIDEDYVPDEDHPLVYHVFGRLESLTGWVLTEDDYFDYLIGVSSPKTTGTIPLPLQRLMRMVNSFLARNALLFLGFQTDDWNFRVLFRLIVKQEGSEARSKRTHVAVQVQPDEDGLARPDRAREFLKDYFVGAYVNVYWGGVDDFVKELVQRPELSTPAARELLV